MNEYFKHVKIMYWCMFRMIKLFLQFLINVYITPITRLIFVNISNFICQNNDKFFIFLQQTFREQLVYLNHPNKTKIVYMFLTETH